MRNNMRVFSLLVAATLFLLSPGGASAQQEGLAEIKRELADLRAEIRQLRAELDAVREGRHVVGPLLRAVRAVEESRRVETTQGPVQSGGEGAREQEVPPSQPSLELLQAQVAELSVVKVESTSKMPVKIFGTIHTNAFLNSGNPNWLDIPNLLNAAPADGHSGSFSASLRQTRLGVTVDGPTLRSFRTSGVAALDFFGGIPGFATGQVMGLPRLLVAFARIENARTAIEVGQDHMIMAPNDPTSLAAFAFPALFRSGNLYLRVPQARVEQVLPFGLHATGGILAPVGGDLPGEDYRFVPQAFGGERSRRPAMQGRLAFASGEPDATRRINAGVAGHFSWERRGAVLAESSATALDFALRRDYFGAAGELFTGDNIDAFGGALGLDARARGGWGEFQLFPTQRLTVAAGGGFDDIRDRTMSLGRLRNHSAYGTALFSLTPEIQASFEYRWLAMLPGQGSERRNHHFDWVLAYKF